MVTQIRSKQLVQSSVSRRRGRNKIVTKNKRTNTTKKENGLIVRLLTDAPANDDKNTEENVEIRTDTREERGMTGLRGTTEPIVLK